MISWCGWNAGCTIFTMDESRLAMLCETRNAASALEQSVPIRVIIHYPSNPMRSILTICFTHFMTHACRVVKHMRVEPRPAGGGCRNSSMQGDVACNDPFQGEPPFLPCRWLIYFLPIWPSTKV